MSDLTPYGGSGNVPAPNQGNGAPGDYPAHRPAPGHGPGGHGGPGPGVPGPGVPPQPVDTIELREVVDVLRRNWKLIGAITFVTVALAAVIVLRQPPEYRAQGMIRLEDERAAMTGGLQGPLMEQALGKTEDPLLSQVQVLRSRGVVGAVVDRLGLRVQFDAHQVPHTLLTDVVVPDEFHGDTAVVRFEASSYSLDRGVGEALEAPYGGSVSTDGYSLTVTERPADVDETELYVLPREKAIDRVLERLGSSPRENTDVVDVSYRATNPRVAQQVANEIIREFQDRNARTAQDQSRRRRVFIEEQLSQADSMLATAQLQLTRFREREQVFSSQEWLAAQQAGLMGLDVRREELEADRSMFRSLLTELENAPPEETGQLLSLVSAPGLSESPVIAALYEQLVRHETSLDSLTTGEWGAAGTNPDVGRLRSMVVSARDRLTGAVESHVSGLDARIAALNDLQVRSATELAAMPATEAEEARLVQQLETVRRMADQLREEYQRARIAEAVEVGQVEVVDPAPLPSEPMGSGRGLKLALAMMLGLMTGSGVAFLKEHMNTAIRRKDDIESVLRVPGLAVIPKIAGKNGANGRGIAGGVAGKLPARSSRASRGAGASRGSREARDGERAARLVAINDGRSSGAEAYRSLRTNLIFSQAVQTIRRLVITSASEAEGKTTTAANLAVTFAQQGVRVLLVDCDLRRPQIHNTFGVIRSPGITELVLGHDSAADAVRETAVEGLHVLPSGTLPPNPSELLGGPRIQGVLDELGRDYDMVILDTPPLLAASDAAILGSRADGVVLVVRAGQTEKGAAQQAVEQLHVVGARIIGAVLNDPDAKVPQYGGHYYYNKYYGE